MYNLIFGAFVLVLSALSGFLVVQYRAFQQETQRLVEIREEYRTYTATFRKLLHENQRLRESDDTDSAQASEEDVEKKKEVPFLVINREPEYLKGSMVRYLKKKRLKQVMHRLQVNGQLESPAQSSVAVETLQRQPYAGVRGRKVRGRRRVRSTYNYSLAMAQINRLRHTALAKKRAEYSDLTLQWPVDRSSFWLSSFFGSRRKPDRTWGFHYGIDMAAIKGTPIMAAGAGVVIEAGVNRGFGKTVVIMHNNKYRTRYAHLDKIHTRVGRQVTVGERIGTVGDTGLVRKRGRYASHLHLEVSVYGKRANPLYFFA